MENKWICTRSRLAGKLSSAGVRLDVVMNPWQPKMVAWECTLTPVAVGVITDFYISIGKPIPQKVDSARIQMIGGQKNG